MHVLTNMETLVFVYNAKSGAVNTIIDIGHKLLSPKTYPCSLCAITHNNFSENEAWKKFRETSSLNMEFHHIDEFEKLYPNENFSYPIILKKEDHTLLEIVSTETINKTETLKALISLLKANIIL